MKKYIQLTAGRGPAECARAVALVARELLKDFPDAELVESEPHNTETDCYMSMLFLAEVDVVKELEWTGTILWRATSNRYRPGYPRKNWFVGVEFIEPVTLPEVSDKVCYNNRFATLACRIFTLVGTGGPAPLRWPFPDR